MSPGYYLRVYLFVFILLATTAPVVAATYYVSPTGSDDNIGSLNQPFRTVRQAVSVVQGGDEIYLRGGVYYLDQTIRIVRASGTSAQPTKLWAYPGEEPILDGSRFSVFDPDAGDNDVLRLWAAHWHLKGLTVRNGQSGGILVAGDDAVGNILEQLTIHDNRDTGLDLYRGASQTLVLNCDSYRNFDPQNNGENADGFAAKFDVGTGNTFRDCRAWANSDDGWDFWKAGSAVTVENCWAYDNGFDIWNFGNDFTGNGNGFKLGRDGGTHLLQNCSAWGNRVRGFDSNGNTSGVTLHNCTGWDNVRDFVFYDPEQHVLRNCLSVTDTVDISGGTDETANSWTLPITVDDSDFQSLSDDVATGPRNADGSLPTSGFLRLADGSDLIDRGVDVGLPFSGDAPDLGAFETEAPTALDASNGVGRAEAEAMDLNNYEVANWTKASGGGIVQMDTQGGIGSVGYRFTGQDGEYDLAIRYLDEPDGASTFTLLTNDVTTRQWAADQVTEGGNQWKILKVSGVFLRQDSRIEIQAGANRDEFARLDYVEVTPVAPSGSLTILARGTTGEETMELRMNDQPVAIWTVTTSWQDYTYDGAIDGDIRVAFTNDKFVRGGIDRNLRVDKITVADQVIEAEAQAINTGAWDGTCGGGSFSERLDCNGYIDFGQVNSNARRAESLSQRPLADKPATTNSALSVYPNPVSDGQFTVRLSHESAYPEDLWLIDSQGRVVLSVPFDGQSVLNVDTHRLQSGIYWLKTSVRNLSQALVIQ